MKTSEQLRTKYKNLKVESKKKLSANAREIQKTGGEPAILDLTNDFDISETEISGFNNRFDSDSNKGLKNSQIKTEFLDDDDMELNNETEKEIYNPDAMELNSSTPKNINKVPRSTKRRRLEDLVSIKKEGIKVEIELKRIMIAKAKMKMELMQLQKEKLRIEIEKLNS